jgi:uncharacterized protein (DUF2336 family)
MMALTRETIAQFTEEASWTARAKAIERVATRYIEGSLNEAERQTAFEVFRAALYDGEPLVRRVLAESVKRATDLPRDVVLGLARDVPEVAAPFLAATPLLDDEDLGNIARDGSTAHRLAIACRPEAGALDDAQRPSDTFCARRRNASQTSTDNTSARNGTIQ